MILYRYFLRTTFFQGIITFHLFLLYIVLMILYSNFLRTTFFQGNITFHLFLLYIVLMILYRYFLRTTFFQGNKKTKLWRHPPLQTMKTMRSLSLWWQLLQVVIFYLSALHSSLFQIAHARFGTSALAGNGRCLPDIWAPSCWWSTAPTLTAPSPCPSLPLAFGIYGPILLPASEHSGLLRPVLFCSSVMLSSVVGGSWFQRSKLRLLGTRHYSCNWDAFC